MNKVYDDGQVVLWHGEFPEAVLFVGAFDLVVTDPPMEHYGHSFLHRRGAQLVHPHYMRECPPADHVSAWIRHSPGIERDGFGHHWNAVLHYGPADLPTDVFWDDEPRVTDHPAERGVRPMMDLLRALPDGVVLDPFCGTGSTLLAARATGRRAIGIEVEERFVQMALRRLEA